MSSEDLSIDRSKKKRGEKNATKNTHKCLLKVMMHRVSSPISKWHHYCGHLHLISYYTLIGGLLHQFGREQGMLRRVRLLGFRNEQTYFLICSSPLRVQLTVVAERYQGPEDVDGEEGDGEGYETHGLQPAPQLKMVLSAAQAQPARNGC